MEAATSRVGLAVIGAGYWGPNLVRNAMATAAMDLRWLCDLDEDRARRVLGPYSTVSTTDSFDAVSRTPPCTRWPSRPPRPRTSRWRSQPSTRASTSSSRSRSRPRWTTGRSSCRRPRTAVSSSCATTRTATPRRSRSCGGSVHTGALGEVQFVDSVRINLGLVQPDVDVLWDLAPHDLSILDFLLPPGAASVAVSAQGADPIGPAWPASAT